MNQFESLSAESAESRLAQIASHEVDCHAQDLAEFDAWLADCEQRAYEAELNSDTNWQASDNEYRAIQRYFDNVQRRTMSRF